MIIAVIDGMGGGIGSQVVHALRDELPSSIDIYALGTNAIATSAMMKQKANKGATGENAGFVTRVWIISADTIPLRLPCSWTGSRR